MAHKLAHRGPDDFGTWSDETNGIALGHRRLSIIDLSRDARQPMIGPSGRAHIVFNGEIYNYRELRSSLRSEGISFRNASDTEVILALYEKYGIECLKFLHGMFAFAIWDSREKRLFLARDRLGKKPLYYISSPRRFLFASEMKALRLAAEPHDLEVDLTSLDRYLSHGFVSGPQTIYRGIVQLPPATALVATATDRLELKRYWNPAGFDRRRMSIAEAVDEADKRITEATRLRLHADVPIGVFLSGGIDSGLVTAMAAEATGRRVRTFTVGFEESGFDERPLARMIARRYGTDHHEVVLRPDVTDLLPAVARAYDQPFADASAIPTYCVARIARHHGLKVMLNGDGGDELFGGYRRSLAAAWFDRVAAVVGERRVARLAKLGVQFLPAPRVHRGFYAFGQRFLRGAAAQERNRIVIWSSDGFMREEKISLGFSGKVDDAEAADLGSYLPQDDGMSLPQRSLALDLFWMLPYALLVKMDVASMAHGVETRSPFLDHQLAEWTMSLPESVKLQGFTTKPLLRRVARKYLPSEVSSAPKRGFEPPLRRWLTNEIKAVRDDLLLAEGGLVTTMFCRVRLERFLQGSFGGDPDRWAHLTWILLMLAAWDYYVARAEAGC